MKPPEHFAAESAQLAELITRLHTVEAERDLLLAQNRLLCGANEKLVLATFAAQTLRDEAKAANQRQNEFLAMLAHELRNPLAPISMAGTMLSRMPSPSPQLLGVQKIIERQVAHLSRLLDDLLDAARINSGKITLARAPILLADQLRCAADTVQLRMAERGQHLRLHVPAENIMLNGDAVRLGQVFSNLLVNASKFTQEGGMIELSAWVVEDKVMITVADNGEGISEEVIPNIFSLFTQGPRSLARSGGGLGIGLNVVKSVIEMHGGTVEASSPGLGFGSVFTLTMPALVAVPAPAVATQQVAPAQLGRRILLVEDNRDASEMLTMFLQSAGHSVVTAFDGITGLAIAIAEHFDVLVCDIGLPGLDGYGVICELTGTVGKKVPFPIAMSGYGQAEDRARALAAGFARYLVKPVDVDELLGLIESAPARRQASRP
jgi:signal transduction histidine kinase/CheY-like chemotaxis protein